MIRFFLERPIFALVCSFAILLAGIVVIPSLPIAQFPKITPPVVTVTANYTGATATTVVVAGAVTQVVPGSAGSGYSSTPVVTASGGVSGGAAGGGGANGNNGGRLYANV